MCTIHQYTHYTQTTNKHKHSSQEEGLTKQRAKETEPARVVKEGGTRNGSIQKTGSKQTERLKGVPRTRVSARKQEKTHVDVALQVQGNALD